MSRLEQAAQRLQSALDRLDRAVGARAEQGGGMDAELRAALEHTKGENAQLQAATAQAAERLDAAIGRLRAVLED
jgi:hypothetical protein